MEKRPFASNQGTAILLERSPRILRTLRPFAKRHRRVLVLGALAALGVVSVRLLLPWLVHALLKPWLLDSGGGATDVTALIRTSLGIGALFALLAAGLGYADYRARLSFARFAIGTVRDLRAAAFDAAVSTTRPKQDARSGDLVARLIGDTARIKTGLKGFFTHVATNGALFIGVSLVLLFVDLQLGLVFAVGGAVLGVITLRSAGQIFQRALRYRAKEGKLAQTVQEASTQWGSHEVFRSINRSSGHHEATLTRIQGVATWWAHGLFGLGVAVALGLGVARVNAGRLTAADLLIFVLYALSMRTPMVQLARQGSRTGKILAAADRLCDVLEAPKFVAAGQELPAPTEGIHLEKVKVLGSKATGKMRRLGPIDLSLEVGTKVLIVGPAGSGKTSLLDLLAGKARAKKGRILWDELELGRGDAALLADQVDYLRHQVAWPRQSFGSVVGVHNGGPTPRQVQLLEELGVSAILGKLPKKWKSPVASSDLSLGERRLVGLARIALGRGALVLVDDPLQGLGRSKAERIVATLLEERGDATVVVTSRRLFAPALFDRVVNLKKGRLVSEASEPNASTSHGAEAREEGVSHAGSR